MTKRTTGHRLAFGMLFFLIVFLTFVGWLTPSAVNESNAQVSATQARVSTTAPLASSATATSVEQEQTTLANVIALAKEIHQELKSELVDYQAKLVKRERIHGKLGPETSMQIKIRNPDSERDDDPGLSVYLKFTEPRAAAGREVIWRQSQNGGNLIAHEGGFKNFLRVSLDPLGRLAMLGNKYPITEIGLLRLVEKLIEKGERDQHMDSARVTIVDSQEVDGRPCRLIEVTHPEQVGDVDFHVAQIFIDTERRVPLRYAAYLWPEKEGGEPLLEEEYTYLDLQLNVGLTDSDFDPDNPDYNFP